MKYFVNMAWNQNQKEVLIQLYAQSFENISVFMYLGAVLTHRNEVCEEIMIKLNSLNAWYYLL
jgi:hypothetical protein